MDKNKVDSIVEILEKTNSDVIKNIQTLKQKVRDTLIRKQAITKNYTTQITKIDKEIDELRNKIINIIQKTYE